jgi:hypothetical protein
MYLENKELTKSRLISFPIIPLNTRFLIAIMNLHKITMKNKVTKTIFSLLTWKSGITNLIAVIKLRSGLSGLSRILTASESKLKFRISRKAPSRVSAKKVMIDFFVLPVRYESNL